MATTFYLGGKAYTLPGAYSTVKSVVQTQGLQASYNNILVIDTGTGAGWGGGSGVSGTLKSGLDSIYKLSSKYDMQNYCKGGYWWKLAEPLFEPFPGVSGVGTVYYVRAAATTPATMTFAPTGGGTAGGSFTIKTIDEGLIANGELLGIAGTELVKGYAFKMKAGIIDPNKFLIEFWRGTYKGIYPKDSIPYDEVTKANAKAELLFKSAEFSNVDELKAWMDSNYNFRNTFYVSAFTKTGTGVVTSADITTYADYTLASGATETYSSSDFNKVVSLIKDLNYNYILSDRYGDSLTADVTGDAGGGYAIGTYNSALLSHVVDQAKFIKFIAIGGGKTADDLDSVSIPAAKAYNTTLVTVVHGDVELNSSSSATGKRRFDALYKTAVVIGRTLGIEPQIPVTNKSINITGGSQLSDNQRLKALQSGVVTTFYNASRGLFIVTQGVNTLQDNSRQINSGDITKISHQIQVMRILSQLDQGFIIKSESELLADPNGVNRNTLSTAVLEAWTSNYLKSVTATEQRDNIITGFENVVVTRQDDAYFVACDVTVNGEITKIFFTTRVVG